MKSTPWSVKSSSSPLLSEGGVKNIAIDSCLINVLSQAQKKRTVFEKRAQQRFIIGDEKGAHMSLGHQLVEITSGEIGHGVGFGVRPKGLDRVEFRGVWRQKTRAYRVAVTHDPSGHRFTDVGLESIPDQHHRHTQVTPELSQ